MNEAIADGGTNILRISPWSQIIGPDFIAKAFEYAHEADPDAILRYNDYGLENPAKRHKLISLIKSLQAQGVPVMAIGSQTHVSVSSPSFEQEDQALTELETLGLQIHITELDVNGSQGGQRKGMGDAASAAASAQGKLVSNADQRLAAQYANLFKVFLKHQKSVKVVTLWGINDGVSWLRGANPLLFDASRPDKPAFEAVIKAATEGVPPATHRSLIRQTIQFTYYIQTKIARIGRIAFLQGKCFFPRHKFLDLHMFWPVKHGRISGSSTAGQNECGQPFSIVRGG